MSDQQSPLVSDPGTTSGTPQADYLALRRALGNRCTCLSSTTIFANRIVPGQGYDRGQVLVDLGLDQLGEGQAISDFPHGELRDRRQRINRRGWFGD